MWNQKSLVQNVLGSKSYITVTIVTRYFTLYCINKYFGKNFHFHSNLSFNLTLALALDCLGNYKSWNVLKTEFKLTGSLYFSCMELINPITSNFKHNYSNANLLLLSHHLIKKNNLISLDKLHCCELYNILIYTSPHQPTSTYILKIFLPSKSQTGRIFTYFLKKYL